MEGLEVRDFTRDPGRDGYVVYLDGERRDDLTKLLWGRSGEKEGEPFYWFLKIPCPKE